MSLDKFTGDIGKVENDSKPKQVESIFPSVNEHESKEIDVLGELSDIMGEANDIPSIDTDNHVDISKADKEKVIEILAEIMGDKIDLSDIIVEDGVKNPDMQDSISVSKILAEIIGEKIDLSDVVIENGEQDSDAQNKDNVPRINTDKENTNFSEDKAYDNDNSRNQDSYEQNKKEKEADDSGDNNIEKDAVLEKIKYYISTKDGLIELMERHPEKTKMFNEVLEAYKTLDDPDASPAEIRSAQSKLNNFKGQILEIAAKDALSDAGLDVEPQQKAVDGENGITKPDVIAKNNTDHPIVVFGKTIQPGETISIECKCASSSYLTSELKNHIPNQLSGHDGISILLTTSDITETKDELVKEVCEKYGTTLVTLDVSVSDVEDAIKEVANK